MRVLIQRVSQACLTIDGKEKSRISHGMVVLLGITHGDSLVEAQYLADKITGLRIFSDTAGKMNLSIADSKGELLVVSQFTLHADCRRGRRPSFINAAPPDISLPLYNEFVTMLRNKGFKVSDGEFGADMQINLTNDGPVTIMLDSEDR